MPLLPHSKRAPFFHSTTLYGIHLVFSIFALLFTSFSVQGESPRIVVSQPTLNKYGYMSDLLLDPYSLDFLIFATQDLTNPKKVLEIGAGFGKLSLEVIHYGGKLTIIDRDAQHIRSLEEHVDKSFRKNIEFVVATFPLETDFEQNSFDAVFLRVCQFLPGNLIEKGLKKISRWLKPGGRLYIIAPTVHIKSVPKYVRDSFQLKRKQGNLWPGENINTRDVFPLSIAENMTAKVHLMDLGTLVNALVRHDFQILDTGYYDSFKRRQIHSLEERNGIGIIGVKA